MSGKNRRRKGLTVQLAVDGGKFRQPAHNFGFQSLQFALGPGRARPGLFQRLLEFPSFLIPELLLLGGSFLQLGNTAPRLLKLGLQPRQLLPLFLQLGLVRKLALLLCGCAKVADARM